MTRSWPYPVPPAALRIVLLPLILLLPRHRQLRVERWLRGREEYFQLQGADWLLVSWGKSGRTWLRVMLSRFYQQRFQLRGQRLLGYDNLHRLNPALPVVFFTHGNYLRDYTGNDFDCKVDYAGKRIVLLVRDPRDVAVSQYFQWRYRMRPRKRWLNGYPDLADGMDMYTFVCQASQGLPRIISYFNGWLSALDGDHDVHVVRYEDLRSATGTVLGGILEFTGLPATATELADAVEYAAFDNLRNLESAKSFPLLRAGRRLLPGDRANPDSYKVRRGKVGGWRDYFDAEQCAVLDAMVERDLVPGFGYTAAERMTDASGGASGGTRASSSSASERR